MMVTCDNASAKQDGRQLVDGTFLLFLYKAYSVRLKAFSSLFKMRNEATLPQHGLVMPHSGTSSTRLSKIVSHRQESRRSSREDCR